MQFWTRLVVFVSSVGFGTLTFSHEIDAAEPEIATVKHWFEDFENLGCNIVITCNDCYNKIFSRRPPSHAITLWNNRKLQFPPTFFVPIKFKRITTRSGHTETFRYMSHCYANFILITKSDSQAEVLGDANLIFHLTEQHEYKTLTTRIFYHFFALKNYNELERMISRIFIKRIKTYHGPAYRNDYTRLAILKLDLKKSDVSSSCTPEEATSPGLVRHEPSETCSLVSHQISQAYVPYVDGTAYRLHKWKVTEGKLGSFVANLEVIRHSLVIQSSAALTSGRGDATLVNDVSFPSHLVPPSILEIVRGINRAFTNKTITLNVPITQVADFLLERKPTYRRTIWYQLFYEAVPVIGSYVPTGDQYFNFISCYDPPETRDVGYLLKPFGLSVWIAGVASFVAFCILLKVFNTRIRNGDILLYYFSALAENCQREPRSSDFRARITLGIALITALLLTNAYRGCMTSKITAPQAKDRPQSFDDLIDSNFTIFASVTDKYKDLVNQWKSADVVQKNSEWLASQLDAEALATFGNYSLAMLTYLGITSLRQLQKNRYRKWRTSSKNSYQFFPASQKLLVSLTKRIRFPKNFPLITVEDELSKCGKTAYVDYAENLGSLKPNLTIWRPASVNSFYPGQTKLMSTPAGFGFANIRTSGTRLKDGLQRLAVESGIFHWLHNRFQPKSRTRLTMIWITQSWQSVIKRRYKGLSTNSKEVRSSLELYSLLVLIGLLVFLVEITITRLTRMQTVRGSSVIAHTIINLPLILVQPTDNSI